MDFKEASSRESGRELGDFRRYPLAGQGSVDQNDEAGMARYAGSSIGHRINRQLQPSSRRDSCGRIGGARPPFGLGTNHGSERGPTTAL